MVILPSQSFYQRLNASDFENSFFPVVFFELACLIYFDSAEYDFRLALI